MHGARRESLQVCFFAKTHEVIRLLQFTMRR